MIQSEKWRTPTPERSLLTLIPNPWPCSAEWTKQRPCISSSHCLTSCHVVSDCLSPAGRITCFIDSLTPSRGSTLSSFRELILDSRSFRILSCSHNRLNLTCRGRDRAEHDLWHSSRYKSVCLCVRLWSRVCAYSRSRLVNVGFTLLHNAVSVHLD